MTQQAFTQVEMTPNPIAMHPNGVMNLEAVNNPWDWAIDCVNYPVYIKPLHYYHPDSDEGEAQLAIGETNTGRDVQFYGIVVDRDRTDQLSTISTVTGMYDTMAAAALYESLQHDLDKEDVKASPYEVYVSGNGGRHRLTVKLDGLDWPDGEMEMSLVLHTSVDGKAKHQIHLAPLDKATGHELVGMASGTFNVSSRHTRALRENHASFSLLIEKLIAEWNDTIVPTMVLMNDCKFDKKFALDILEQLAEAGDLPDKHKEQVIEYYTKSPDNHTLFSVFRGMSDYLGDELADKPERLALFKEKMSKRSDSIIKKTLQKMRG